MTHTRHGFHAPDGVRHHNGPRNNCINPKCQAPGPALGARVTITAGQPYELTWIEETCPWEGRNGTLVEVDHDTTNRDFYAPYRVDVDGHRVWVAGVADVEVLAQEQKRAQQHVERAHPSWYPHVVRTLARDYPEISEEVWSTAVTDKCEEQVAKDPAATKKLEALWQVDPATVKKLGAL